MAASRALIAALLTLAVCTAAGSDDVVTRAIEWQQIDPEPSYTLAAERRVYTNLDRAARFVLAVQVGRGGKTEAVSAAWALHRGDEAVLTGEAPLATGMACVDFDMGRLAPGSYVLSAAFRRGDQTLETRTTPIEIGRVDPPAAAGRIAIILPTGADVGDGVAPLTFGVPFPKGALRDPSRVRVVDAAGKSVPVQTTVRSRWGYGPDADVRWLGVDLQSPSAKPYWPDRKDIAYHLEFGPDVKPETAAKPLVIAETEQGFRVDTGAMQCTLRRGRFNLLDEVVVNGRSAIAANHTAGLYLVDHEGTTYRAVNDRTSTLILEEQGPLRAVFRAEGWYVKDGADGSHHDLHLPTDRLCRFVTRIEFYAGQPMARVLSTWVITYDSFSVRLRDLGLSIPAPGSQRATFGVDGAASIESTIPPAGVRLVQHLTDRFDVESDTQASIATGARSDGQTTVAGPSHVVSVSLRDAWQRFPKEFEALPGELRVHLWPAHGREHGDIDPLAKDRYHQLWFAHQGREMNLVVPWETLFTAMRLSDNPSTGIYAPGGTIMGGVHAGAMGAAITSDLLIQFREAKDAPAAAIAAKSFQQRPHALADPAWLARSGAMGEIHPYDPENFALMEDAASDLLRASWSLQDKTGEYGMFLYRTWHHGAYNAGGFWDPYRLYSAGHHYEAYVPWLYYARSGDPSMFHNAMATIRQLSDLGITHYDDPGYEHREFYARNGRMVGSVGHTNGYVLWGGDHTLLGHPTCFNGLMTAYYLTGDLRLREVVVDEWQHTLLEDRGNKARNSYVRDGIGRDNNNALGELIDLYQLTYDPRLLAFIEPRLELFTKNLATWGLPLQNVLSFNGDSRVTALLKDSVEARLRGEKVDRWNAFYARCAAGTMAAASLLEPARGYGTRAMLMADAPLLKQAAATQFDPAGRSFTYCVIPDYLLYYPMVMAAAAKERAATGDRLPAGAFLQPFPAANTGFSRIIVREDVDAPFDVTLPGTIGGEGAAMQVFDPRGKNVVQQRVGPGANVGVQVPADGVSGEYVVFVQLRDGPDTVFTPLTSLPGEVYVTADWHQFQPTRYFTAAANMADGSVAVAPHVTPGSITSADDRQLLASTQTGELLSVALPADGLWITMRGRYATPKDRRPLILAVSRERFFKPSQHSLELKPQP